MTTPPTILFLGSKDRIIPVATAETYAKRMSDAGAQCELRIYDGEPHGFFNYAKRSNFITTMIEVDRFLASLGYLDGEPTLKSTIPGS